MDDPTTVYKTCNNYCRMFRAHYAVISTTNRFVRIFISFFGARTTSTYKVRKTSLRNWQSYRLIRTKNLTVPSQPPYSHLESLVRSSYNCVHSYVQTPEEAHNNKLMIHCNMLTITVGIVVLLLIYVVLSYESLVTLLLVRTPYQQFRELLLWPSQNKRKNYSFLKNNRSQNFSSNTNHLYSVGPTSSTLIQHCTNVLCLLGYHYKWARPWDSSWKCCRAYILTVSTSPCFKSRILWLLFFFKSPSMV